MNGFESRNVGEGQKGQEDLWANMAEQFTEVRSSITNLQNSIATLTKLVTLSLQNKGHTKSNSISKASRNSDTPMQQSSTTTQPLDLIAIDEDQFPPKRIDIPNFDGADPIGWLARAEQLQYFAIQRTCDELKVATVFLSMEGAALHCLRWLQQQTPTLSWAQFKVELMDQFSSDLAAPPNEQLPASHQVGMVDEFVTEFMARATQIPNLAPHIQLGLFLNGLKEEIRVCLRPNNVLDLRTAMKVARSVERELGYIYHEQRSTTGNSDEVPGMGWAISLAQHVNLLCPHLQITLQ